MLKKKGVFDEMRPADVLVDPSLGEPSSRITRVVANVSSGAYDTCLEGPFASFEGFVETHCSDTQVTLPTVPSSTEVTATTVPFPLLPYDRLRTQEILYQSTPAARHQQMSAQVRARLERN